MDMEQYIEIFIDESREHLQLLNETLLSLEHNQDNKDLINEIFRVAHTLKGMSGTMGFTKMQSLTHEMENVLSEIRDGKIEVNSNLLDVLFKCLDANETFVNNIETSGNEGEEEFEELVGVLKSIFEGDSSYLVEETQEIKESEDIAQENLGLETNSELISREHKHLNMNINEYVIEVATNAKKEDYKVYGLTVYINEKCVLKSARAFLVFKELEQVGDVIYAEPSVQDIEDENFEDFFSLLLLSKVSISEIKQRISNISEIDEVTIDEMKFKKSVEKTEETAQIAKNNKKTSQSRNENQPNQFQEEKKSKTVKTVRVDIERLDTLMNLVSELIIVKNSLENVEGSKQENIFNESIEYLERITTNLHDAVMKVRMVPIEQVFSRFPRMIRDLSRKLNKEIELNITGKETELDRTVIDEIGDPLVHLLRNAADHGLETIEERRECGKPTMGTIDLKAYQDGNNVVIEVKDDGKGIDISKITDKAIAKGVISKEELDIMSEEDIIDLLFRPSFSTSEAITDVSGRGVGLDVVKTKIQSLGGSIEVKTELGQGSTFIIRLPLTLAMIQALMVNIGEEKYAIPLNIIQTIEEVKVEDIRIVQGNEVIVLRDQLIPINRLDNILDISSKQEDEEYLTVVIARKGEKLAGFTVDSLIGQQEIVIKSLGKYLNNIKIIAGATILGDGEVALILDINSLV